jgi:Helix-turn-helix domain
MNGEPELSVALADALRPLVVKLVAEELDRLRADLAPPDWLTLDEAAVRYRLSPDALRKRAQRGSLPGAVKDESRWLINRAALDEALLAARVRPPRDGRAPRERPRPGIRRL